MSLCWWCCHDIGNSKIGVPTERIVERPRRPYVPFFMVSITPPLPISEDITKYELEGQFCTFECARAHIIDNGDYLYANKLQRLSFMRRQSFKDKGVATKDIPRFKSAPSWKTLKQFGGTLAYEEFRTDDEDWVIQDPGFIFNAPNVMKRRQHIAEKTTWKEKQELIHKSTKSSEQLKIKRSKPRTTATGFGDISSTLGIKVIVKE